MGAVEDDHGPERGGLTPQAAGRSRSRWHRPYTPPRRTFVKLVAGGGRTEEAGGVRRREWR